MAKSAAKYYVVYEPSVEKARPWVTAVSDPYTKADGKHTLRRFRRKKNAVAYAKDLAKRNNERVAVNKRNGATHEHYDYED